MPCYWTGTGTRLLLRLLLAAAMLEVEVDRFYVIFWTVARLVDCICLLNLLLDKLYLFRLDGLRNWTVFLSKMNLLIDCYRFG